MATNRSDAAIPRDAALVSTPAPGASARRRRWIVRRHFKITPRYITTHLRVYHGNGSPNFACSFSFGFFRGRNG